MNYRTGFFILAIVLGGLVSYMIFKPSDVDNSYIELQLKQSQDRVDSLTNLFNNNQPIRNELKDTMLTIDSVYIDISKDSLRARIGHNMLTYSNR